MGVGKESDIYLVMSPSAKPENSSKGDTTTIPEQAILKLHRLGRTSFRSLSNNRAYQGSREHCTWQQLSKLSAQKEFAAMRALYNAGYPVPRPIAHNRHTVVMSLVPGLPLRNVTLESFGEVADELIGEEEGVDQETAKRELQKAERDSKIALLYAAIMEQALNLAEVGVIHGDFNEFNILVSNVPDSDDSIPLPKEPMVPILIDFPQITSFSHPQAQMYFDRDVQCIKTYFRRRYHFESSESGPTFEEAMERRNTSAKRMLDVEVEAMGFNRKLGRELEEALRAQRNGIDEGQDDGNDEDDDDRGDDAEQEEETNQDVHEHNESLQELISDGERALKTPADMRELQVSMERLPDTMASMDAAIDLQPAALTAESLSALAELSLTPSTTSTKQSMSGGKPTNVLKKAAGWAI